MLRIGVAVVLYLVLAGAIWLSPDARISAGAILAVVTLILAPALWRGARVAWMTWVPGMLIGIWLIANGHARMLLDLASVAIGVFLCWVFARTLLPGRQPFIARAVHVVGGLERLAQPGVAGYARGLTIAWALLFALQAALALFCVFFTIPDGLLAGFGVDPPIAITRDTAEIVHWLSLAAYLMFFIVEFAYRHWRLREHDQLPARLYVSRLIRHWPQLLRDSPQQRSAESRTSAHDWTQSLLVTAGHPSLAGHFPGNPVVPGVVLLDRMAAALEAAGFSAPARLASVKFLAPLRPQHEVALRLQVDDRRVRFSIIDGERTIMRGEGELA